VTGYTPDEALQMNIADVLAPDSVDTAREMLARKAKDKVATVMISKSLPRMVVELPRS